MRFSMRGIARIENGQGLLALRVDQERVARGHGIMLVAIMGEFNYHPLGRKALEKMGATDFEGDKLQPPVPRLNFEAPAGKLDDVTGWFLSQEHRDTAITTILIERLTRDQLLRPGNLTDFNQSFARYRRLKIPTSDGVVLCFTETFSVFLPARAMEILTQAAKVDFVRRKLHWVTPEEIYGGFAHSGLSIGSAGRLLL